MTTGNCNAEIPSRPGIYQIRCVSNGKIYVGSAVNLRTRWQGHRRDLGNRVHVNRHMQQAWNRYGGKDFAFTILEFAEVPDLLERERAWIERTRCTDRTLGFNVNPHTTSAGSGFGLTWVGFRDPAGNPVTIINLADFCRRNLLNSGAMGQLARGTSKLKSHKGWTHENSVRERDYIKVHSGFVDPQGDPVGPIRNLAAFSRKHELENTHMTALAKGRIVSYRGWTHENSRPRSTRFVHKGFVAPDGTRVQIRNLAAFCRIHDLCKVHMFEVKSGKRARHKGWTWKQHATD